MPDSPTCHQLPLWVSVGRNVPEPDLQEDALVIMEHKLWTNGSTITYSFLDGGHGSQLKETVHSTIAEYQRYANINFKRLADNDKSANIRITTGSKPGASAVGIDALRMLEGGPTMKLHTVNTRTEEMYPYVLHMIGHALGLMHEEDDYSNFPDLDDESIMCITTRLNPRLSDSDKAWLAVNYPGREATIDGTTWTLMYSLGVLELPAHVIASILTSSNVSKKRDLYTRYIMESSDHHHVKKRVEAIKFVSQEGDLSHAEPPPLGDVGFMDVSGESSGAPPPPQPDDDEFSESVAAAVMHPQFRAALSNVVQQYINDNAPKLGLKPQPAAAQPSNAVQSAVPQHFLGVVLPFILPTVIDLVSKLVQSGIQPNNIQSALAPNGIQSIGATGRVLSPAEQQVMNGFFTSIFGNPIFKSVLKGVVKTVTNQDEE